MRSINHLYNACHIKCYYDCGPESVSAVLKLARFQDCLVALWSPPIINLSMGAIHACRCVSECELESGSCARSHGPHLHRLGGCQGQIRRIFTATFLKLSAG